MSRASIPAILSFLLLATLAIPPLALGAGSGHEDAAAHREALPARAGYSDEFDGNTLDPKWNWFNSPASSDVGVTVPGHLRMVARRMTNFAGSADNGAMIYQNISGSYSIETKLSANPQNDYEKAGLMIRQNGSNWVALKYQAEGGAQVELSSKTGGSIVDRKLTAITANPVWLRLDRTGSSFTTHYSTDGVNWTQQWTGSVMLTDPLMVGLIIADGNANSDFTADFDYFRFKLPNQPPGIKAAFTPVTLNEDERLGLKVLDHFYDPDGDNLTFKVEAPHISGKFNNATNDLEIFGPPNWFGVENARVTATDPMGLWIQAPMNVTVLPVEDPPFLNRSIPNVTMAQNGTDSFLDLSKYFIDNDTQYGDRLTWGVFGNGSIQVGIAPQGKVTLAAPISLWGVFNITFTATDNATLTASGICKVTVEHVNQAPQVKAEPPDLKVDEDDSVTMDFSPVFWDPDGDAITIVASGNDQIDVAQLNGTLKLTFKPKADASGFTESIRLTAVDDKGLGRNSVTVKVTVNAVNDPPRITKATPAGDVNISENQTLELSISASDPESGAAVTYEWSLDGRPALLGIPAFVYRTDFTSAGDHTVTVSASDGELSTTMIWRVRVQNVNREPTDLRILSPRPGDVVSEGSLTIFDGSALDPDDDLLVYIWFEGTTELGRGRNLTIALPAGSHSVMLQVSDGTATVKGRSIAFSVKSNSAPQLLSLDPPNGQRFDKGARILFKVDARDAEDDIMTYCWTENGRPLSGSPSFYRSDLSTGSHLIHLSISDGRLATETNLTVEISEPRAGGMSTMLLAGIGGAVAAGIIVAAVAFLLVRRRRPPVPEAMPVEDDDWDKTSEEKAGLK